MISAELSPRQATPHPADPSAYVSWKQWTASGFGSCLAMEAAFFEAELRPLIGDLACKPKVLELGFGNGQFLGWCKQRDFDYSGVEIDPTMRVRARDAGIDTFDSVFDPAVEISLESFDLVAAFDVIEHIEQAELVAVFAQIRRLLKTGGFFIARFPNGDSPFGRVNQHGDMTHVTTLGRGKIFHMAAMTGFSVVSVADPKRPWSGVGFTNGVRRLLGGIAKKVLETSIRTLYYGGEPVCFDRNCVAVLKKDAVPQIASPPA